MGYGNFRGNSGGFGGPRRSFGGGGFRRNFGPREMTKIKCAECGKEDEVPFKPRDGSSVLCKECYMKKKGIEPRAGSFEKAPAKAKKESSEEDADEFAEDADESEATGEEEM